MHESDSKNTYFIAEKWLSRITMLKESIRNGFVRTAQPVCKLPNPAPASPFKPTLIVFIFHWAISLVPFSLLDKVFTLQGIPRNSRRGRTSKRANQKPVITMI
jgi:hypothetical protein